MTDLDTNVQHTMGQKRFRPVHRFSDGHTLVLIQELTGTLRYRIWNGTSWSVVADLPSGPAGMTMDRCFAAAVVSDALYVLFRGNGLSGPDFTLYKASGYSGSSFSTGQSWNLNAFNTGGSTLDADAWYDAPRGFFHVGGAFGGATPGVYAVAVSLAGVLLAKSPLILGGSVWDNVSVSVDSTGLILLTFGSTADSATYGAPVGYASGAYSWDSTTMEKPVINLDGTAESYSDSAVTDVLYEDRTNSTVYYLKRTGTQVYTEPAPSGFTLLGSWTMAHDDTSADLWLFVVSRARYLSGEIYAYRLPAGGTAWAGPTLVAGGDAQGYDLPKAGLRVIGGNADLVYLRGTSSPYTLVYTSYGAIQAYAPPTNLQPNGTCDTVTPTLTFQTAGATPGNAVRGIQVQVLDSGGSTVTWDSGLITTGWTIDGGGKVTYNLPSAAGLAFGATNKWQAQAIDTESAGGSGTLSGYSTQATLTPYHPVAATLGEVSVAGTPVLASPVTLSTPIIDTVHATVSQADGHTVDQAQIALLQSDGATEIERSPVYGLTPAVASAGTVSTPSFTTTGLVNLSTDKIALWVRDATTLVWYRSDLWELDVNWAPPPNPTDVTVTPNANGGWIDFGMTLDASVTAVKMQRAIANSGNWSDLETKSGASTFTDYPVPRVTYDYRFIAYNAEGVASSGTVEPAVMLPLAYSAFGQRLSDPSQPQWVTVPLGTGQDMPSTSTWQTPDQPFVLRTAGSQYSKVSYDQLLDTLGPSRAYLIPRALNGGQAMRGVYPADANGIVDGYIWVQMLRALHDAHLTCHFRSSVGRKDKAVTIENFQEAAHSVSFYVVTFDLRERPYFAAPVAG